MRLSNVKIRDMILDECKLVWHVNVENLKNEDSWYGRNKTFTFNIKEIKGWLFAIMIWKNEKKTKTIHLIGERENWIDKFKPGRCSIDVEVEINSSGKSEKYQYKEDFDPWMDLLADVSDDIRALKRNRKTVEYIIESHGAEPFLKWLFEDIWFYNVRKPIENWWTHKALLKVAEVAVKIWNLNKNIDVTIYETEDCQPSFDLIIDYKDELSDEEISNIYFSIKKRPLYKILERWNEPVHRYKRRCFYIDD